MDVNQTQTRITEHQATLRRLERELWRPGPMVAGAIVQRYKVCGRPGCRCARGHKHGPYPGLSLPRGGMVHLRAEVHQQIEPLVERYRQFQRHLAEWRQTVREVDHLFGQLRDAQVQDLERFRQPPERRKSR